MRSLLKRVVMSSWRSMLNSAAAALVLICPALVFSAEKDSVQVKPEQAGKTLKDVSGEISGLVTFEVEKDRLKLVEQKWKDRLEAFGSHLKIVGCSKGLNSISWHLSGHHLRGTFSRRGEKIGINIREQGQTGRSLEIQKGPGSLLRISLFGPDGYLALLDQEAFGRVSFVRINLKDKNVLAVCEESYGALCRRHRKKLKAQSVRDELGKLGLALPDVEGAFPAAQEPEGEFPRPLIDKGPFQTYAQHIGNVLRITLDKENLAFDWDFFNSLYKDIGKQELKKRITAELKRRRTSDRSVKRRVKRLLEAPNIVHEFRKLMEASQTRSGSHSTVYRNFRFDMRGRDLHLQFRGSQGKLYARFIERKRPFREAEITDSGTGMLRVVVFAPDGFTCILQRPEGTCALAQVLQGRAFTSCEPTFIAAYRKHRRHIDACIFPHIRQTGTVLFPAVTSPEVIEAVSNRLSMLNQEKPKHPDDQAKPESRKQIEIARLITSLKLLSDVDYLIDIIGSAPERTRAVIADRLRKLTEKKQ